jgi:hypothetical protein
MSPALSDAGLAARSVAVVLGLVASLLLGGLAATAHAASGRWNLLPFHAPGRRVPGTGPGGPIAGAGFTAVSCPAARTCTAVGSDGDQLVAALHGTAWSVQNLAPIAANMLQPTSVDCPTTTVCETAGTTAGGMFIERWALGSWSDQPIAPYGTTPQLAGVACGSVNSCVAVGSYDADTGDTWAFSETMSPLDAWSGHAVPGPAGPHPNPGVAADRSIVADEEDGTLPWGSLAGVSCTSEAFCMAVGQFNENVPVDGDSSIDSIYATVAVRWNGVSWVPADTPQTTGLTAVSCAHPQNDCLAVGQFAHAQLYAHGAWRALPIPDRRGAKLTSVSCPRVRTCVIAGTAGGHVAIWRWTAGAGVVRQTAPTPRGAVFVAVTGVSCATPSSCLAVGTFTAKGGARYPLAVRYGT